MSRSPRTSPSVAPHKPHRQADAMAGPWLKLGRWWEPPGAGRGWHRRLRPAPAPASSTVMSHLSFSLDLLSATPSINFFSSCLNIAANRGAKNEVGITGRRNPSPRLLLMAKLW